MMHPNYRDLLAAYTPDELATIFREELEALRIPYTIKHPTHFQFTPLSSDDFDSVIVSLNWKVNSCTPKLVFPSVSYQQQSLSVQELSPIVPSSTQQIGYNLKSLSDLGRVA